MFEYKGYRAEVEFDPDAEIFHGEVLGTKDVVTFQGSSVAALKKSFRDSIDDYLDFCAERGEQPDKPFTGRLMVRLSPTLHRELHAQAKLEKKSLNQLIAEKLKRVG